MAETHEEKVWHIPYTAEQIQAATGKSPVISSGENGDWMVWDIERMQYVDTGVRAFIGNIDEAGVNADRAEAAATTAAADARTAAADAKTAAADAKTASDAAAVAVDVMQSISGLGGGAPGYSSDIWLFITGNHPVLNVGPYRDYETLKIKVMREQLAREITTPEVGTNFTVYDGGNL